MPPFAVFREVLVLPRDLLRRPICRENEDLILEDPFVPRDPFPSLFHFLRSDSGCANSEQVPSAS